jgi:hypothetical protein
MCSATFTKGRNIGNSQQTRLRIAQIRFQYYTNSRNIFFVYALLDDRLR